MAKAKAAEREFMNDKLRNLARRKLRQVKYGNSFEEQAGPIDGTPMWPFGFEGFENRREYMQARVEARSLFKLADSLIVEQSPPTGADGPTIWQGVKAAAGFAVTAASVVRKGNLQKVAEGMDKVASVAKRVGETASTIETAISSIRQVFRDMYDSFVKYVPLALAGACLISFVLWLRGTQQMPSFMWLAVCCLTAELLGEKAWKDVKTFFEKDPPAVEEQSGFACGAASAVVAFLLRHHLGAYMDFPSTFYAGQLLQNIGNMPRAHAGLKAVIEWTVGVAEKVINCVRDWMDMPAIRLVEKHGEEIDKLVLEVAYVVNSEMTGGSKDSPDARLNKVMQLYGTCWNLRNLYRGHREITLELGNLMSNLTRVAAPLRAVVGSACGYTQQPVSICLLGDAGVGKTMMVQNLSTIVLKEANLISEDITEQEASKLIYVKPFNSEYMDGYHGQPVYLLDDFMMKKATPQDTSNGFLDLMTYYSAFTNMVNMAACEHKGMWPFSSKILMMTTNMEHPDQANASQVLLHLPALARRVDVHYKVTVRPEFRLPGETKLDYAKFELELAKCSKENAFESYPWHVWEVFPTTWDNVPVPHCTPGTGRPFALVLAEIIDLLHRRKDSHLGALACAKSILKAPKAGLDYIKHKAGIQEQAPSVDMSAFPEITPASDDEFSSVIGLDEELRLLLEEARAKAPVADSCLPPLSEIGPGIYDDADSVSDAGFVDSTTFRGWWTGVRDRTKSYLSGLASVVSQFVRDYPIMTAAIAAVAVGGLMLLYHACQGIWEWLRSQFMPNVVEEQSNRPKFSAVKFSKLKQQSGSLEEGSQRTVYNNSFKIGVYNTCGEAKVLGQVTYLEMDYLVMPKHFDDRLHDSLRTGSITPDSMMFMRSCRSAEECMKVKVSHWLDFPRSCSDFRDLCFVRTKALYCARKITHFLVRESEFKDVGGLAVRLDTARISEDDMLIKFNDRIAFMSKSVEVGRHGVTIGKTRHTNWLRYSADTIDGDCGATLCLQRAQRFQHRVWLGIHVGCKTSDSEAYATQLTAELVERHLGELKKETGDPRVREATFAETVEQSGMDIMPGFDLIDVDTMPFKGVDAPYDEMVGFGSFSPIGTLTKVVSAPVKTNLIPTFVMDDDMLDDNMPDFVLRPMRLAPYLDHDEMVYPSVRALEPYAGDVVSIDVSLVRDAVVTAMRPFASSTVNILGRVWSTKEALVGANGAKGVPLGTSVGLPGCLLHRNKRAMLDGAMEWDFSSPTVIKLMEEVEALERMVQDGIRPFFMARGFLKDELRKPGKGARYIAGTNVHYYILCRKYFGQIVSTQMNQFKDSGMCPGINPYQDWEWLQNHITKHGAKVWDGDFSGFDTSQQPQLLAECLNYINSWYAARGGTVAESNVRTILFQDLMKSRHAVGRGVVATHVVQWQRSLPSGHFLTTFINTMMSMTCLAAAYIRTVGDLNFWDNASAATLGDDNVCGASDAVIDAFNQVTVAEVLREEFAMTYTAGRKGEELKPYLSVDEITFLQRSFRLKQNRVVGPIRKESIYGALLYTKRGDAKYRRETLCQNIEGCLSELSLWPEETWANDVPAISRIASKVEYAPKMMIDDSQDYFRFTCLRQDTGWF